MPQRVGSRQLVLMVAVALAPAVQAQAPKVGGRAPEFTLPTIAGDSVRLSQFRGHPVVLSFWATWCPSCRTEMPALAAARKAHADVGLEIVTVNGEQTVVQIGRYLRDLPPGSDAGVFYLLDPRHRQGDRYAIPVLPSTLFVDTGGVLRAIHHGALRAEELDRYLHAILPTSTQE